MRHILVTALIVAGYLATSFGQLQTLEPASSKHEVKLNALYALIGIPEVSYEYIWSDAKSIGSSVAIATDGDLDLRFMLTPYFRAYFGNRRAAGFFVEVNSALFIHDFNERLNTERRTTGFGLGAAIGGKFINRENLGVELYAGAGRNLIDVNEIWGYGRLGINLIYRFSSSPRP